MTRVLAALLACLLPLAALGQTNNPPTLGTITGGPLSAASGGTGVANAAGSTLTAGGALTTTGTGPTTLAFPSSTATFTFPSASKTLMASDYSNGAAITGLFLGAGAGAPSAYAGTSCTNQFPRSLSAAGAATCASVANADLAGSIAFSKLVGTDFTTAAVGDSTQKPATTAFVNAEIPPAPNLLVNPSVEIDQKNEGASVTLTSNAAAAYCVDGWRALYSSAATSVTCQRVADGPGTFPNSIKVTVGTGSAIIASNYLILEQPIRANQISALGLGTSSAANVCISGQAKSSVSGYTFSISLQAYDAGRSYPYNVTLSGAAWQATPFSTCFVVDTGGSWVTSGTAGGALLRIGIAVGANFQGTANTWVAANDIGTSSNTNTVLSTSGATFNLTNMKLEVSPVATPFARRDYPTELKIAQYSYRKTFPVGTAPAQNAGVAGSLCMRNPIATGDPSRAWMFGPMATTPTITTYNPSAANANWRDVTAAADATVSVDPATAIGLDEVLLATSGTVTTLGDTLCIHATANSQL